MRRRHAACLPHADDDEVSIGEGEHARAWPVSALPDSNVVPWNTLHAIPKAVVSGSNGKTTSGAPARGDAARARPAPGYSSTDGLMVDGACIRPVTTPARSVRAPCCVIRACRRRCWKRRAAAPASRPGARDAPTSHWSPMSAPITSASTVSTPWTTSLGEADRGQVAGGRRRAGRQCR